MEMKGSDHSLIPTSLKHMFHKAADRPNPTSGDDAERINMKHKILGCMGLGTWVQLSTRAGREYPYAG